MNSYNDYITSTENRFPYWKPIFQKTPPHPNLLCFSTVQLPDSLFQQAQSFINTAYKLRNNLEYQHAILSHPITQPHFSVLMSFDFHVVNNHLKLIEINTNASHALTNYTLLEYLNPQRKNFLNVETKIIESFKLEYELYFNKLPQKILILDANVLDQKAYFEFLMYQELFKQNNIQCEIADIKDVSFNGTDILYKDEVFDFIYNRHTDFYFDKTLQLKAAYSNHRVCMTPHPEEYQLLADKNRLFNFKDTTFLKPYLSEQDIQILNNFVPDIQHLTPESFDAIWKNKDHYFFKPAQSHGSKAAYKGENVSKKKILEVMNSYQIVAQEYIPAATLQIASQNQTLDAKYDLRFYVYNGTIQLVSARLYQGQTTNFNTAGLGLAPVLFDSHI